MQKATPKICALPSHTTIGDVILPIFGKISKIVSIPRSFKFVELFFLYIVTFIDKNKPVGENVTEYLDPKSLDLLFKCLPL